MAERAVSDNGKSRQPEAGHVLRRVQALVKGAVDRFVGYDPITGVLFVLGVALLLYVQAQGIHYGELQAGQVAGRAYYVPYEVTLEDEEETARLRELARRESPPVYSWNPADLAANVDRLGRFFLAGRTFLEDQGIPEGRRISLSPEARAELWERLAYDVEQESLDLFLRWRFSGDLESALLGAYQRVMRGKVAPTPPSLDQADHILLQGPDGSETPFYEVDSIVDVATARGQVLETVREQTAGMGGSGAGLVSFLDRFLTANLRPEAAETQLRRAEAVDLVSPAIRVHRKGQKIAGKGELLKADEVQLLRDIEDSRPVGSKYRMAAGALVVLGLLVFFLRRYIRVHQREFKDRQGLFGMNMVVALGIAVLSFALLQLAGVLAEGFSSDPFSRVLPYQFGIPVAAGALLMGMLTNARMAMVSSVVVSVAFGMLAGWDLPLALYALLGSFAGIYGITQYEVRTAIIKAGLVVGGANVVTILALAAVADQLTPLSYLMFAMGCGLVGGVLVATTASFTLPVLEWMFNVMTDIRLLELSNLNSPLLRKLAVQAPGTYNHSVIVGTLAESAAESVGVGALLCRVAAYYHDIGKMKKPEYFIENSRNATALHQKLSPTMSSLIILSHVKDGAKMARDFNLPQPIQDFILQHHGTRLVSYFFKKAKKMEHREIQEVSESNFRYPGPKPQSKEAAIFMMADSVEAAARTVDDPTPAKFKDLIRKIINAVILDDQLSETDLTFSDLDKIQSSFQKTLSSIYHHRIEYPGFRFDDRPGRDRATLPA